MRSIFDAVDISSIRRNQHPLLMIVRFIVAAERNYRLKYPERYIFRSLKRNYEKKADFND